jgi:hypothetical protein
MGFGRKSRKEAQTAQVNALNQQNAILAEGQRQAAEYRASSSTRNAPMIQMQADATAFLNKYKKGEDVSTLNPALAQTLNNAANQTTNTLKYATAKLGDTSGQGDAGHQQKLLNVTQRKLGQGVAALNMQGLQDEVGNQRGIAMDTTNFLNADAQAGFGMQGQLSSMASSVFQNATTRRQMEIQRSNQMMGNLMGFVNGGLSAVFGGGLGGIFGGGGGNSG